MFSETELNMDCLAKAAFALPYACLHQVIIILKNKTKYHMHCKLYSKNWRLLNS